MNDIKVIFEDQDFLVLDKPSGVTVNRAETTKEELTVQDYLEEKFRNNEAWLTADKESDFYQRAGFVHRIDKETSGILVVAKNPVSFENLQAQFKERNVSKTYIALVHGHVQLPEGEIVVPVGRLPWNRKRFGVLAGGKEATTYYKVIKTFEKPFTLLELNPKTGRTHQIRVHLKYFNHPIFGDSLYAGRKTSRDDRKILERVFLHAQKISFSHPKTGERIGFESPLPYELQSVLNYLENQSVTQRG
jgi:23S rRNA pseudouridine1911/1915/1917 synthase